MYSGAGNKQCGYGEGKKSGAGKYTYINGTWVPTGSTNVPKEFVSQKETFDKDIVKMGKEICRMSQLGEKHKHKELEGSINKKLFEFKEDKNLSNTIVKDVLDQYKSENHRR